MNAITPTRRRFLQTSGLILGLSLPAGRAAARAVSGNAPEAPFAPNAFVRVTPENKVVIVIKNIEFGQGPATGLATLAADEMDADWPQIAVEMAPANDALYANAAFHTMGTGGSTAIATAFMQMREAGAAARAMLVEAAAKRWGVPVSQVTASKGVVSHGDRRATFGELANDAAALTPPEKPVLKTPEQWALIGTDVPKVDSAIKSDGSVQFTMDVRRPNMVHSAILHPPAFGGKLASVDDSAAMAVPGVLAVKPVPQGVAVYARDTYAAMRGRAALKVEWDLSAAERRSSEELFRVCATAAAEPGTEAEANGDVASALAGAAKTIEATYYFPYLAHAPMEPLDAVIEMNGDSMEMWMGAQMQVAQLSAAAKVLGVPPEKAVLHQQYAGGSFGRRVEPTMAFPVEAASVFKAYGGRAPVKHVWTRENDLTGGYYRPIMVHRLRGGVDAAGRIVGWDQVIAGQSFARGTPMEPMMIQDGIDTTMVEGAKESGYAFPAHRLGTHIVDSPVPTLWWRSVGSTHTAYSVETFLDRLLELGGVDPVAGRLALMEEDRRKGVLTRVAELADWGSAVPEGRARGVAVHKSFGTYVAQIAEVSRGADGVPRVHKVWCAVDCGVPVNPNVIRAQMEGGIGYGLGHALYSELVLGDGGVVQQHNFDTYRSLRIGEMPEVEVAVIASREDPTGVGEPGLPPIAPAVANAWRKLTGKAVDRLPFIHGDNV